MSAKNLKNVDPRQDYVKMEKDRMEKWEKDKVVEKYLHKNDKSKENFSFIDGPITANNPMGIHHAWGRTYKDVVQRYKNLKGFEQRFQNGFDCQGLWVEVGVEKALKFNSKKDILDYGIGNFTNTCKARVEKFAALQTEQSKRLGMFMDWDNSYYTMSEENNLSIWHFLKVVQEKGFLRKGKSATTWCPRCETGLSQHEQSDGYKDVEDQSVYVKAKLVDRKNEYLLVWTTTPWTLSSNVMIAVNPDLVYVKVKDGDDYLYMVDMAADSLGFKDYEQIDIKKLVGLKYVPLYEDIPAQKEIVNDPVAHTVVEWDLVEATSGSGMVHIAPGCGQEDYELGLELKAPQVAPLDTAGRFMKGYGELDGKYAHDVAQEVFDYLEKEGKLFKVEKYTHSYPHCWRCGTKCLFRLEDNWYIDLDSVRQKMKDEVNSVYFTPEFGKNRMLDWLDNMGPWMISRKRFYGLSLPFYECEKCGNLHVVGSKKELKELAVKPELVDELPSLHRPWIDDVKIKCPKCGNEVTRVTDVGDCWLDAGVVPFSTLKYFEDKKYWNKWYPADFITEMIEQVRLWFYSMTVYGIVLEGKIPFKSALTFAEMRDESNERMSKTKPNYVEFNLAADKVGTDIIRWNFVTASTGTNMRFGWPTLEAVRRQFYLPLWNSYSYLVTYAKMHDWDNKKYDVNKVTHLMDKWFVARFKSLLKTVEDKMDKYDIYTATKEIDSFVQDLSTWYIRRSRDRFRNGDNDALGTLHFVLSKLSIVLAPFIPFIADEMYENLVVNLDLKDKKESVHLEDYPQLGDFDQKLLDDVESLKSVCSLGLNIRDEKRLKLRQPLTKAYSSVENTELLDVLKEELNVKEVEFSKKPIEGEGLVTMEGNYAFVTLDTNLTDELLLEGKLNEFARNIQKLRKESGLMIEDKVELVYFTEGKDFLKLIKMFEKELKKRVGLKSVVAVTKDDISENSSLMKHEEEEILFAVKK